MAIHYRIVKGQLGSQSAALSVGAARVVDDQLAQRRSMPMARIGVAHRPRSEAVVAVRAVLRAEAHMLGGLGLPAVRQRGSSSRTSCVTLCRSAGVGPVMRSPASCTASPG